MFIEVIKVQWGMEWPVVLPIEYSAVFKARENIRYLKFPVGGPPVDLAEFLRFFILDIVQTSAKGCFDFYNFSKIKVNGNSNLKNTCQRIL